MAKKQQGKPEYVTVISNRKARFEFEIFDTFEAGIELLGSEVKSVRLGKASLSESYAMIHHGQVWLENMQITPYEHNTLDELEPKRSRRLLLHKAEIMRLQSKISEKGLTLIPLKAYFNKRGVLKIELGLARGKKLYDKRETIKNRDAERQLQQIRKQY
ncbi:SsrA-binding protein SmpB [Chlorobaculum thiosulfatiphilum]|uniref:SsrA-binding protein n=1 Tax=Chlorobaculum thiosulfatiphilum TaxID=115852 RepID=A0A5C4S7H8_CHLTI|nr:SsrA-binding protein SmpB [Chlorobaculum thiosulfatiphilum]TNJ38939.1 SsrA-binding protein SmpB [Chlorobaculum thiosulfatiphilum]